jgi:hypothetical protein
MPVFVFNVLGICSELAVNPCGPLSARHIHKREKPHVRPLFHDRMRMQFPLLTDIHRESKIMDEK